MKMANYTDDFISFYFLKIVPFLISQGLCLEAIPCQKKCWKQIRRFHYFYGESNFSSGIKLSIKVKKKFQLGQLVLTQGHKGTELRNTTWDHYSIKFVL